MKCPICDGMGTSNTCVNGTFKPCSFCDGKGYYETESSYGTEQVKCHCQQEQTNEEWIKTATTEELAETLAKEFAETAELLFSKNYDMVFKENTKWWVEWLKQPHNAKE